MRQMDRLHYAIRREIPFVKQNNVENKTKNTKSNSNEIDLRFNEPENDYMTDNEAELVKMFHGSIELKLTFSQFM